MRFLRPTLLLASIALTATLAITLIPTQAQAQATCRQKCMDEENACLKRTGNKSQCGDGGQSCSTKCR